MQQTRTHKAVTPRIEAKKLLSRQRQTEYSPSSIGMISFKFYVKMPFCNIL